MRAVLVMGFLVAASSEAAADYKGDLERVAGEIKNTPPRPGVEQAAPASGARPAWCGPLTEAPYLGGMTSHLGSYYDDPVNKVYALVGAAEALCKNDTSQPVIKLATREIVQLWMNIYGLSAPDAVESLKITVAKGARDAGQKKACTALALDDEIGGAERAFIRAKRDLFDCPGSIDQRISSMGSSPMVALVPWLDSSAKAPDELVRLAFVSKEVDAFVNAKGDYRDKVLLGYAINQFDFKDLDPKAALHAVSNDPALKGNAWAQVVVKETLGQTRLAMMAMQDEIKKKTDKDPDWKMLLITAPQQGYNDWLAASAKYKAELQRSAEFEQTAFGPSRKANAGCQKALKADLVPILKSLKRTTATEFLAEMNKHPVAGLLFRRLQACVAVDGDKMAAKEMLKINGIRVMRGPRVAAYYAVMDALGKIRADRTKFSVQESDIPIERQDILEQLTYDLARDATPTGYSVWDGKGVIKTMKKGKDGINVVFAKDKQQIWSQSCKQLNRIIMFANDGRPIYDQSCTGKVITADVSPDPINVPEHLAEGLAPGRQVSFGVSNSQDRRISMPFEIYADKKGKNLVGYYGIEIK